MCLRTFKCTTLSFVDAILIIIMAFELQMWMNVLEVLIFVMKMQFATILKGVILAFATVDTLAMDFFVLVSSILPTISNTADTIFTVHIIIQMLMSASATMEVVTTAALIQMEVIFVPVIMATSLTVMDTNAMVNRHL